MASRDPHGQDVVVRAAVAGRAVSPKLITVAQGSDWRTPAGATPITVEIAREFALDRFQSYYNDYVNDGRLYPPDADPASAPAESCVEWQLMKAGWPPLERLMADLPRLYETFVVSVAFDFLNELFRSTAAPQTGHAICKLEEARLEDRSLVLRGLAVRF